VRGKSAQLRRRRASASDIMRFITDMTRVRAVLTRPPHQRQSRLRATVFAHPGAQVQTDEQRPPGSAAPTGRLVARSSKSAHHLDGRGRHRLERHVLSAGEKETRPTPPRFHLVAQRHSSRRNSLPSGKIGWKTMTFVLCRPRRSTGRCPVKMCPEHWRGSRPSRIARSTATTSMVLKGRLDLLPEARR